MCIHDYATRAGNIADTVCVHIYLHTYIYIYRTSGAQNDNTKKNKYSSHEGYVGTHICLYMSIERHCFPDRTPERGDVCICILYDWMYICTNSKENR